MIKNHFISGDHNLICDVCSVKVKASKTRTRWDGFQVCPSCYEQRHPQDFVKARQDKISVPFTRPRPTDEFVVIACTAYTAQGIADLGTADCAMADTDYGLREYTDAWMGK